MQPPVLCSSMSLLYVQSGAGMEVPDGRLGAGNTGVNQIELQEIVFKNYYTAFLSIRVRQHTSIHTPAKWVTCLRNYCLMPDPHSEEGAQEYVSLFKHQMLCDMARVLELRLILRQPSPLWLSFTVEELQIYQQRPKSPSMAFPKWLSHPVPCEQPTPLHEVSPTLGKNHLRMALVSSTGPGGPLSARIWGWTQGPPLSLCHLPAGYLLLDHGI
ncbi:nicolin-1 isoform 4-T4 [Trichechus inunguis]